MWPQGALVKHVRGLFKADGINVTAEPGNSMHARFYVSDIDLEQTHDMHGIKIISTLISF